MQSKSLVLIFIVVITFPIIAISTNHEIFFAAVSLIIALISARNIFRQLSGESLKGNEADEEIEEELEELVNIDVKKFGTGLSVVYNLLVILFLCYCAFFLEAFIFKVIASFSILFQIYFIINKTGKYLATFNPDKNKPQFLLSSVLNISVILFTILSKLKY